jgi:hypothetical protein
MKNDGGPNFPMPIDIHGNPMGLTLLDYFAAKAMQGMLSEWHRVGPGYVPMDNSMDKLAVNCYQIAKAMLKARGEQ